MSGFNTRSGVVHKLSPHTNVCDCPQIVYEYIKASGHLRSQINTLDVWVRYQNRRTVAVGPTEESVTPKESI